MQGEKIGNASYCVATRMHARTQVKILGDGTQELTTIVIDRLEDELGITATSFTPTKAVVGGGATGVGTGAALVAEEKTAHTLLLVLLFLRLYYNHNKNT
jgi:hypothetical protein